MLKRLLAILTALPLLFSDVPENASGFWHTNGRSVTDPYGVPAALHGMGFGNDFWTDSLSETGLHHSESSYKEMQELGFNSVRFLLNYHWFEDDIRPYVYKQEGFDLLDRNIAWAKKYGIGLVLNMHCPQGGYQSQGKGTALWTDQENQNRLAALWGEIARRYADEPTIIGYGIVNEPVVPEKGTAEETVAQCRSLVQRCTDEIRRYDGNHIIFAERVAAVQDISTGVMLWEKYSAESLWYLIDDSNVIYEAHFYEPFSFTHQTAQRTAQYPSEEPYAVDYVSYWSGCISAVQTETSRYYETDLFRRTEEYDLFSPALHTNKLGQGSVLFKDITVTEYAPDGSSQVIWQEDLSDASAWSSDGSGEYRFEQGGCRVSGANEDYVLTLRSFELKEGYRYKVGGNIAADRLPEGCTVDIRADFSLAEKVFGSGREYIEYRLSEIAAFGEKNNVPVYIGEFGADAESFREDRGGERWVADVLDQLIAHGLSFSYHAYHETMFGLYPEDTIRLPQHRNEALARVFADKLRSG